MVTIMIMYTADIIITAVKKTIFSCSANKDNIYDFQLCERKTGGVHLASKYTHVCCSCGGGGDKTRAKGIKNPPPQGDRPQKLLIK